jgi:hypothetical protein
MSVVSSAEHVLVLCRQCGDGRRPTDRECGVPLSNRDRPLVVDDADAWSKDELEDVST